MSSNDRIPVPGDGNEPGAQPHVVRVDYDADTWSCVCGEAGRGDPRPSDSFIAYDDAGEKARHHAESKAIAEIQLLTDTQLVDALRLGAVDSQLSAAVELLVAHGHWLHSGYLRRHMVGGWHLDGRFEVRITWDTVAVAIGSLDAAARDLVDADEVDPALRDDLRRWQRARYDTEDPNPIHGSSSEIAILRIAASIMGRLRLNLGNDTSNLDNRNRGRALTAIAHLLSHGGQVPFRAGVTWSDYHNGAER